jgi:hypothetical protein
MLNFMHKLFLMLLKKTLPLHWKFFFLFYIISIQAIYIYQNITWHERICEIEEIEDLWNIYNLYNNVT